MSRSRIFTLNSGHVGLADNLILRVDKHFINAGAISNPEIPLPSCNQCPQVFKGLATSIP
jgi:hypothetical protein